MLQPPQWATSVWVFTHALPQRIVPGAHSHEPSTHISVAVHARPQLPQFIASLEVFTQRSPHSSVAPEHSQRPPTHDALAPQS